MRILIVQRARGFPQRGMCTIRNEQEKGGSNQLYLFSNRRPAMLQSFIRSHGGNSHPVRNTPHPSTPWQHRCPPPWPSLAASGTTLRPGRGELDPRRKVLPARNPVLVLFRVLHRAPKTNSEQAELPHRNRRDAARQAAGFG